MRCPTCVEQDLKSKVYSEGATKTLLGGGGTFWDENGAKHHHDPNRVTSYYRCSNNHRWSSCAHEMCLNGYCDYGREEPEVRRYEDVSEGQRGYTRTQTLTNKTFSGK